MRYITDMPDVTITNIEGTPLKDEKGEDAKLTFKSFVLSRLLDETFAKDMASIVSAVQIKTAVNVSNGVIAVESTDWELLRDAVKAPKGGYNPTIAHCLLPFMRAVVEATEMHP